MSGLGMVMEGALRLLGPLLFPVFLAMWVIVQVNRSSSFHVLSTS
jgi:hypothetical protein